MTPYRLVACGVLSLLAAAGLCACAGAQPSGLAAEPAGVTVYGTADAGIGRIGSK